MRKITQKHIDKYKLYLIEQEKAKATIEKYIRDINAFSIWMGEEKFDKTRVLEYKALLIENYKPASVNSVLSSLNSFFNYQKWYEMRVKTLKIQRQMFSKKERELSKKEYERLVRAAGNNKRLSYLMQTICSTGIRISELRFITVESVKEECASISCKGKIRTVLLPKNLCKILGEYIKKRRISSGPIFISRNVNPLDRSNVWKMMKRLCRKACVIQEKVFPHNLRHLFARTYYSLQKDVIRLADILGHSSVNTTRIYTMESGYVHRQQIQKLGLLLQ